MIDETLLKELRTAEAQEPAEENETRSSFVLRFTGPCSANISERFRDHTEMVYVCSGHLTCMSGDAAFQLKKGELLFLSPDFPCQFCGTGPRDTAVSFLILPEFFNQLLPLIEDRQAPLRQFLLDCLFRQNTGPGYLCFQVSHIVQVQNLAENLLLSCREGSSRISELTLTLLCLELLGCTEAIYHDRQAELIPRMLDYIDGNYTDGRLADAAGLLEYDVSILSREIRRQTGKTFTELIQRKRMSQAASLLRTTALTVEAISRSVGYENVSYFHRLFRSTFGMTPRQYRTGKP